MTHKQVCLATNWRFLCRNIVFMGSIESNLVLFCGLWGYLFGRKNSLIKILPCVNDRVLRGWGERRAGRTCIWNAREILYWYGSCQRNRRWDASKKEENLYSNAAYARASLMKPSSTLWNLKLHFYDPLIFVQFFKAMQLKSSLLTIKIFELIFYILSLFLTIWGFLVE